MIEFIERPYPKGLTTHEGGHWISMERRRKSSMKYGDPNEMPDERAYDNLETISRLRQMLSDALTWVPTAQAENGEYLVPLRNTIQVELYGIKVR